jgi:hypothetical protein
MLKAEAMRGPGGRVVVMDSITQATEDEAGAFVVSGSHGGTSSGEFALSVPLAAAFFNDAGVGKDCAGIAALAMLQSRGVAAGTVSHGSARIGDAADALANGVVSHVNGCASRLGVEPGERLQAALARLVARAAGSGGGGPGDGGPA